MDEAKADVEAFKKRFVEFRNAEFHYQWIEKLDDCMTVLDMDRGAVVARPKR